MYAVRTHGQTCAFHVLILVARPPYEKLGLAEIQCGQCALCISLMGVGHKIGGHIDHDMGFTLRITP